MPTTLLQRPQDEDVDPYSAPGDGDELYRRDWEWIKALVRRRWADLRPCDVEDVAADIREKLVARNVMGMYRPDVVSKHTNRRVTWRAFLSNQVNLYIRGKREEYGRRGGRELLVVDAPVGESATPWQDLHAGSHTDRYLVEDVEKFQRMRDWLATQPPAPGPLPLLDLFDEYWRIAQGGENPTRAHMARKFGLDSHQAKVALDQLRSALAELPEIAEPLRFEVSGISVSAVQVATAVAALKSAKGNRVAPALAAAGSPLANLSTQQYIALGKQELKSYPGLKVDAASRGSNTTTKDAVIHMLERLLSEAGAAVPQPDPGPLTVRDFLEEKLWHIPGLEPDQVDAILDAAESVYARV